MLPITVTAGNPEIDSLRSIVMRQHGRELVSSLDLLSKKTGIDSPHVALEYKIRALEEAYELRDNSLIAEMLIDLGYMYKSIGNLQLALNNFNRAYFLSNQQNDYINKLESLTGLGKSVQCPEHV